MKQQSVFWRHGALVLAITAGIGLAACSKKEAPPAPAAPAGTAAAPTPAAPVAAPATDEQVRTKAQTAEREQRLYAPDKDNAIEYYLELRQRNPKDTLVNNALQDLFPYAMMATEQNLQKGDRVEAARIFALLERIDKNAPSLPRLRETMQKEAATEMKAQQDAAKKAEDLAAKQAEAAKAAAAVAAEQRAQATQPPPQPVREQPVVRPPPPPPVQTQVQQSAPPPPVQAPPKPARPAGGLPNVVSSAQPDYPRAALRNGISGEVTVSFTVDADGSVSGANIVSSNPRGVFDRAALDAIRKWKFEAPGEAVTGRRTFSFTPGQ